MPTEPARSRLRERRPAARDDLWILGLVGRAGSGKTTVARALAEDGATVVAADRIGHEVTDGDADVRAALTAEYGADVYRADGTLDRARVAARVFADRVARARLDRLTHPRILERIRGRIADLARERRGVVVIDAALLLDWGLERECDAVMAITAPEELQVRRLTRARGWTEEEARARLAAQRRDAEYGAAADVTIVNDGTPEDLVRAAREAVARLRPDR